MKRSWKCVHLNTGDRDAARQISAWIAKHRVEAHSLTDAFEACVYLLQNRDSAPHFVFVCADWLPPEERGIVSYIRGTWPEAVIIVTGGVEGAVAITDDARTHVCGSSAELGRLLEKTPEALFGPVDSAAPESDAPDPIEAPESAPSDEPDAPPTAPKPGLRKNKPADQGRLPRIVRDFKDEEGSSSLFLSRRLTQDELSSFRPGRRASASD